MRLLGAGYGVLEEGIVIKSWYDPKLDECNRCVARFESIRDQRPLTAVERCVSCCDLHRSVHPDRAEHINFDRALDFKTLDNDGISDLCRFCDCISSNDHYSYKTGGWQYLLGFVLFGIFAMLGWRGVNLPSGRKGVPTIWNLDPYTMFVVVLFTVFYTLSNAVAKWFVIIPLALLLYVGYALFFSMMD